MKKNRVWIYFIAVIFFIAFVYYVLLPILFISSSNMGIVADNNTDYSESNMVSSIVDNVNPLDTAFGGLMASLPSESKNIPHYLYAAKADSLTQIQRKLTEMEMTRTTTTFVSFISLGLKKNMVQKKDSASRNQFFLVAKDYRLKNHMDKFFTQNGKYYLAVYKPVPYNNSKSTLCYFRKEIGVFYDDKLFEVNFPISKSHYSVINFFYTVMQFVGFLIYALFVFFIPFSFVRATFLGKTFSLQMIRWLKLITAVSIGFFFLSIIIDFVLQLYNQNHLPEEFKSNTIFVTQLTKFFIPFYVAIVSFSLLAAFRKGYKLQQEQDLTV